MLALLDGKERSLGEWRALLESGGFRLLAAHPLRTPSSLSLLEVAPL